MVGIQDVTQTEMQTKIQPGDLVFTHPQDNPEHIKRLSSYTHCTPYLVLGIDTNARSAPEPWYRIMAISKVTGEAKIIKLPENMLTKYEELL